MKAHFLSVVPSPYQRDLFAALARRPEIDLRVDYLEAASPDSPWPAKPLAAYERVLPGLHLACRGARFHLNRMPSDLIAADVVVLNGYMGTVAQRLLRRPADRRPPLLFWGERMAPGGRGGWRARLQHGLAAPLARCAGIVAIGRAAAADYRTRYPGVPVHELPYCCDLAAFRAQPGSRPHTPPVLLFCGQMIRRKGIDLLLQAFAGLRARGIACRLLLVGREGDLPRLLAGLPEAVRADIAYAGFQAPEALPEYFARADLFVLPSRYDGWGVVVNQALGAGLPVVCADAVGAAELIEQGSNGLVVPAGDAGALEAALADLLADRTALARMGEAAAASSAKLDPAVGARRWVEILHDNLKC
jgi:glycosyltransferase involved in cell wall biosynthesis